MSLNRTRIKVTVHEDQYTLLIIPHSFLLRMRNVSNKRCTKNKKTHFVFSKFFFENLNIYEKIWKNIVEGADHVTIWPYTLHIGYQRLQIHKHTSCVLIVAFSTATMVARTRLNITLYVHCQSVCYCLRETTRIMSIMNVYLLMNLYKSHHFIYGTPEKTDSNYRTLRLNIII